MSGDELLKVLSALANPHRLRIVAALSAGRNYVSALARELGLSRPLLHLHLQRLQAAGLVNSSMELSDDGKALNWYSVAPFAVRLDPGTIASAVATLSLDGTGKDL